MMLAVTTKFSIAKRKYDINPDNNRLIRRQLRVSFTFRKTSSQKCRCPFIEYCDWDRNGVMKIPQNDEHGKRIEDNYVATVYESIAEHFDTTRHSRWVAVSEFLKQLPPTSILFDVGCGNGKYLVRSDGLVKIGCDMCESLCRIAKGKGCNVVRADALTLPYRDSTADAVISIAVIHHMSTEKRRMRAIEELLRVLTIGGRACITVWAMEQTHNNVVSEYLKMRGKKCHVQMNRRDSNGRLRVHEGQDFTQQDMLVPWQNADGQRFLRYYHLFVAGELEELCNRISTCEIERSLYEEGNWITILRKVSSSQNA
uniref:Methyltransf_11 domain-containing protein n=1 Tax=Ascaris lumbricoides TaxID=6252 RepID=A0A0M3ILZ5_ASCLU